MTPSNSPSAAFWPTVGSRIRAFRRHQGWSAQTLANQAHLTRQHLVHLESGQGSTSLPRLWAIADALHQPVERLWAAQTISLQEFVEPIAQAITAHHLPDADLARVAEFIEFLHWQRTNA